MGDKTGISWCDATWNPVRGCSRVSEGCRHCYAERVAARFCGPGQPYEGLAQHIAPRDLLDRVGGRRSGWTREVRMVPEHLADPLRWRRPRRIFVANMSDPNHEKLSDDDRDSIVAVIALADWHVYQWLTKRAAEARRYFSDPERPRKILIAMDRVAVDVAMDGVDEEWRSSPRSSLYEISNYGRVRRGERVLAEVAHGQGYRQCAFSVDGVVTTHLVHRLVLEAFDRPARDGEEAAHRNGNRSDNRIANLRWTSKDDNMQDAARHGTAGVWMKGRATLTADEIADIRRARLDAGEKLDVVAARFGITKQQVSAIALGKIFKPAPLAWPLPHLWLGVSVENQEAADERIPELLATPAAVRFLSCEPLIGPVQLHWQLWESDPTGPRNRERRRRLLHWIIGGCESGPDARRCEIEWLRSLRDQCTAAGVPFFLKQANHDRQAGPVLAGRGSKVKAGGVIELPYLDGVQHAAFPEVTRA